MSVYPRMYPEVYPGRERSSGVQHSGLTPSATGCSGFAEAIVPVESPALIGHSSSR